MNKPWRIYLVGAHSTGKTTLARWIRDRYGLPMISEVARGVLAEMEDQLENIRSDLDVVDRYQREVFERQILAEEQHDGDFVSDRAFCNLAYAGSHATILPEIFSDPRLMSYMNSVREGIVFFLRRFILALGTDCVASTVNLPDDGTGFLAVSLLHFRGKRSDSIGRRPEGMRIEIIGKWIFRQDLKIGLAGGLEGMDFIRCRQ